MRIANGIATNTTAIPFLGRRTGSDSTSASPYIYISEYSGCEELDNVVVSWFAAAAFEQTFLVAEVDPVARDAYQKHRRDEHNQNSAEIIVHYTYRGKDRRKPVKTP